MREQTVPTAYETPKLTVLGDLATLTQATPTPTPTPTPSRIVVG